MLHSISIRGRFLITAMLFALIADFLCIFIPMLYSVTVYYDRETVVWFIPPKNFWLLGLAFGAVFFNLLMLAFKRNYITYILTAIIIVASICIGYLSFLSVTIINNEHIYIKDLFDEETYLWSEMNEVVLYYDEEENYEEYVFSLSDGSQITMWNNPKLKVGAPALYSIFQKYNIPYSAQPAP